MNVRGSIISLTGGSQCELWVDSNSLRRRDMFVTLLKAKTKGHDDFDKMPPLQMN